MRETTTSAIESRQTGLRVVTAGIAAVFVILATAAVFLFLALPSGEPLVEVVNQFAVDAQPTTPTEIELVAILGRTSIAYSEVIGSYRSIIFVLMVFAAGLMAAAIAFLAMLIRLNRRMGEIVSKGLEVNSLSIARDQNLVYLNNFEFKLTGAAMETLSVLAEARLDDEVMTGAQIEGVISGRDASDCDEAAGATRIKRLRDSLGNQMMSELLVKNIARQGYVLNIAPDVIRMT